LAEVMGFHRMVDFISKGWKSLDTFSASIWPMIQDFKDLALLITFPQEDSYKASIQNFIGISHEKRIEEVTSDIWEDIKASVSIYINMLLKKYPIFMVGNKEES
jgi:hypothetical protein